MVQVDELRKEFVSNSLNVEVQRPVIAGHAKGNSLKFETVLKI